MKAKSVIINLVTISLMSISSYGVMFLGTDETPVMPASDVGEDVVAEDAGDVSYQDLLTQLHDEDRVIRLNALLQLLSELPSIENEEARGAIISQIGDYLIKPIVEGRFEEISQQLVYDTYIAREAVKGLVKIYPELSDSEKKIVDAVLPSEGRDIDFWQRWLDEYLINYLYRGLYVGVIEVKCPEFSFPASLLDYGTLGYNIYINPKLSRILDKAIFPTFDSLSSDERELLEDFLVTFYDADYYGMGNALRESIVHFIKGGANYSKYLQYLENKVQKRWGITLDDEDKRWLDDCVRILQRFISPLTQEEKTYIRELQPIPVLLRGYTRFSRIPDFEEINEILEKLKEEGKVVFIKKGMNISGEEYLKGEKIPIFYGNLEEYKDAIARALIAAVAGLEWNPNHYVGSMCLGEERITFWLNTQELIPKDKIKDVEDITREMYNHMLSVRYGSNYGSYVLCDLYRECGGKCGWGHKYVTGGINTPYAGWGAAFLMPLIPYYVPPSESVKSVDTEFGKLSPGEEISYEELKDRLEALGSVYVKLGNEFVKLTKIDFPHSGGVVNPLNWAGVIVEYEDSNGELHRINAKREFIPNWDQKVYFSLEEIPEWAKMVMDFSKDESPYVENFGRWEVGDFDLIDSTTEDTDYWVEKFSIGGYETCADIGWYQTGLWVKFNEEAKKLLIPGSALAFELRASENNNIEYIKVELKDEKSGRVLTQLIYPAEGLNPEEGKIFVLPVPELPEDAELTLAIGAVGKYVSKPLEEWFVVGNIYVE